MKPTKEEILLMKDVLAERIRNSSSLTYDQAYRASEYLIDSETVIYATLFELAYPPIKELENGK